MTRTWTLAIGALLLFAAHDAAAADGDCEYRGEGFSESADFSGTCVAVKNVPAGCPVHFVVDHATTLAAGLPTATVVDGAGMPVTGNTIALVTTLDQEASAVDVPDSNCNCDPVTFRVTFDRFVLTVPNAQPGDAVVFSNTAGVPTKNAMESFVYFVAPGPCPDTWPTSFSFRAACDPCTTPIAPAGGPGSDGTGVDHGAGGCTVSGAREALATGALIAIALGLRRRRR